jgi:hypothetical protein
MENNINYFQKYLKYKNKYLQLKQEGGGNKNFIIIFDGNINLEPLFGDIYNEKKEKVYKNVYNEMETVNNETKYKNMTSPFYFKKKQNDFLNDITNNNFERFSDNYYENGQFNMNKKVPENSLTNFTYKSLIETTWPYSTYSGIHSVTSNFLHNILKSQSFSNPVKTRFAFITFNNFSKFNEVFIINYELVSPYIYPIISRTSTNSGINSGVVAF